MQFFLYDTPKVLLLLTLVVFVMGMVNSYFTPERTRALLAGRRHSVTSPSPGARRSEDRVARRLNAPRAH